MYLLIFLMQETTLNRFKLVEPKIYFIWTFHNITFLQVFFRWYGYAPYVGRCVSTFRDSL